MMKRLNIAIVGATGIVGRMILSIIEERKFPIDNIYLLAGKNSLGKKIFFEKYELIVENLESFNFSQVDITFFSCGSFISKNFVPIAVDSGSIVIDNSSYYRYEEDIPLIVPEINSACISKYISRRIISNPNCSTIGMALVLKPFLDFVGVRKVHVTTYQSVSGSGKKGINELITQFKLLLNGYAINKPIIYPYQIAFNVIPHIDDFYENGYTLEEMKMIWETKKIIGNHDILINPTAVRVPVLYGHSEVLNLELKNLLSIDEAKRILKKASGIKLIDSSMCNKYPTPVSHAIGKDEVFVGRVRKDITNPCGLNLWIVLDNIRKGSATNMVQIAEILQRDYF
ncbi:aspartate-semialdehyde dehydrogenase [Candidatus Legionella polyplacis]|uniref:Aspartate-semialdehyde dehydrogenase n=1 Tax=Candidatus Legionella polyplacis TaxID=2005262 RepID=A0ABZ2GXW3_9GAMM